MAPREFKRSERVAGELRRELAQLIQRELKDPAVGFVSVSDVEVSRDLSHAKVFITVMGKDDDEDAVKANLRILNDASGFLRMQLGKAMKLRTVPQLHFNYDASVRRGVELTSLIERAVAEDRKHSDDVGE